jgi:8-oxo-dGTP pyrophosphatase MutT (NUDIX family)
MGFQLETARVTRAARGDSLIFDPGFEHELGRLLTSRRKKVLPTDGMTTAAVLLPLFTAQGRPHVLLTKRSEHVEHHRGEISFPGGKLDPEDPSLRSCALRETSEEVGLAPKDVRVVGELDDFYTVATAYLVVPFVGFIPYPYDFRPSAREIAELISVPLEVFFDASLKREEEWLFKGEPVTVIFYHWQGHVIWGATARIINHFTEVVTEWDHRLLGQGGG